MIPVLHAVTNDEIVMRSDFIDRARRVMHAGTTRVAVHVRAPRLGGRGLYDLACRLAELQTVTQAWVIVTDRADVALASGARGVQLTSRSISPADTRRVAPSLAIGASVHSTIDARDAADAGAQWLVAGQASTGNANAPEDEHHIAFVGRLAAEHALPIIAIGGVRPEHVSALREAGAYGVAAIRGIWNALDAGAAVIDYLSAHGTPGER